VRKIIVAFVFALAGAPAVASEKTNVMDKVNQFNDNRITDGIATLAKPKHVDVTGDRAYAVVPATYTYKENGKKVAESGSFLTVALQKSAAGWVITGWAWTKH
jgi:hypothetical protein